MWWREPEDDVIPEARRLGIGVVPYGPLGRGFLASPVPATELGEGDLRRGDARFSGQDVEVNLAAATVLDRWRRSEGSPRPSSPLAWLLYKAPTWSDTGDEAGRTPSGECGRDSVELDAYDVARIEMAAPREAWAGSHVAFGAYRSERVGSAMPPS